GPRGQDEGPSGADAWLRCVARAAHLCGSRPLPDAVALRAVRARSAHFAALRDDPRRARRWRPRDDGPRRRRGRRTRERVLLQAVRGRRVRRCAPTRAPPLSRGWRAVGGTPYPSDARGSLVDRIGQAICRDVFGRGEGPEGGVKGVKTDVKRSIGGLEELLGTLPPEARAAASRIFAVSTTVGR